ncbi:MAG: hypothetical protein E6Y18_06245 [Serratia marcescens]|uniref:hypothetical protein n=1 Tax=Serratia nevei TaxID=2703794 RepID=UPI0029118A61|nr:hypothetical protein [Serratia marcescens]
MTTIKRFTPDYKMHAVRFEAFAREAEHGELVQFDDHQQAVSDLEAERDAARNAIAAIYKAVTGECPEWSNWHAYLDDIVEEVGAKLAALQAQGVEKAAAALDALSSQSASATTQANFRAAAVYLRTTVLPAIGEAK